MKDSSLCAWTGKNLDFPPISNGHLNSVMHSWQCTWAGINCQFETFLLKTRCDAGFTRRGWCSSDLNSSDSQGLTQVLFLLFLFCTSANFNLCSDHSAWIWGLRRSRDGRQCAGLVSHCQWLWARIPWPLPAPGGWSRGEEEPDRNIDHPFNVIWHHRTGENCNHNAPWGDCGMDWWPCSPRNECVGSFLGKNEELVQLLGVPLGLCVH